MKLKEVKSVSFVFTVLLLAVLLNGCAAIYTDIKTPMPTINLNTNADSQTKRGEAFCTSYVWVVAVGDCSVTAAMKDGEIAKIHHVDAETKNIFFGIYHKHTTIVYGE